MRELTTLAQAVDQISEGNVLGACDTLIQRFKAVETAHSDNHWRLAEQLEVIPDLRISAMDPLERESAARRLRTERNLELMAASQSKSGGSSSQH